MNYFIILTIFSAKIILVSSISQWGVVAQGSANALSKNRCALKCHKAEFSAVIDQNEHCSCDSFAYSVLNTVLFYVGKTTLPLRAWLFVPLTNAPLANTFKSFGTENVMVHIHGSPMLFDMDGPTGRLPGKKALHLLSTDTSYLEYSIPQSLIDKFLVKGGILTFWMKFSKMDNMPIIEFENDQHLQVWQYQVGYTMTLLHQPDARLPSDPTWTGKTHPADTVWHHYAIIVKPNGDAELRKDGVRYDGDPPAGRSGSITGTDLSRMLASKMFLGHRVGHSFVADAGFFCLVLQEYGGKTPAQVAATINEAKQACDSF